MYNQEPGDCEDVRISTMAETQGVGLTKLVSMQGATEYIPQGTDKHIYFQHV